MAGAGGGSGAESATGFAILTVCTGNICRSPVAEHHLRAQLAAVPGVSVSSAGTMAVEGDDMTPQARQLAEGNGVPPGTHAARYLREAYLRESNLVLALSREHRREIVSLLPRASRYTFTLREFARLARDITDSDLSEIARLPADDAAGRLAAAVALVASRRGSVEAPQQATDDDVIDPYRRDDATYSLSGSQLFPASEIVAGLLTRAVSIRPADTTTGTERRAERSPS
ncbi:arsenate reductase/protein-tyrosine-phosphatase family protein [Planctomonas psychrotolerans]|uniref:arsenate reductase/protein-tyrosine-phosphatase family protein n=1 Tax=Planctomonas psychrotolerans TaxID=2528712 RepID=UPI00123A2A1C|nr:low molecular weight phosphatase family protein [Planctomonas psychrotolerans]